MAFKHGIISCVWTLICSNAGQENWNSSIRNCHCGYLEPQTHNPYLCQFTIINIALVVSSGWVDVMNPGCGTSSSTHHSKMMTDYNYWCSFQCNKNSWEQKKHWETIRSDWEQFTVILHVKISSTWITSFPPKFQMNRLVFSVVEPLENPMRQKDEQSHAGWVTRTILQFEVFLLLIAYKDFYDIIKNTSLPIDWLTSEVEYNLGTETDVTRVKLRFMQKKNNSKQTNTLTHACSHWMGRNARVKQWILPFMAYAFEWNAIEKRSCDAPHCSMSLFYARNKYHFGEIEIRIWSYGLANACLFPIHFIADCLSFALFILFARARARLASCMIYVFMRFIVFAVHVCIMNVCSGRVNA